MHGPIKIRTNGNTAYIYNITKIKTVQFILCLNTGYLSIGILDLPGI
jgi:hypothetical protein